MEYEHQLTRPVPFWLRELVDLENPHCYPPTYPPTRMASANAEDAEDDTYSPFLGLPRELRDEIYDLSLDWNDAIKVFEKHPGNCRYLVCTDPECHHPAPRPIYRSTPTVLLLEKQTTNEALERLYKKQLTIPLELLLEKYHRHQLYDFITRGTLRKVRSLKIVVPNLTEMYNNLQYVAHGYGVDVRYFFLNTWQVSVDIGHSLTSTLSVHNLTKLHIEDEHDNSLLSDFFVISLAKKIKGVEEVKFTGPRLAQACADVKTQLMAKNSQYGKGAQRIVAPTQLRPYISNWVTAKHYQYSYNI